jgi:hypothetical protein
VVGAASVIGKRLERPLGYSGRMETTVLLEEPEEPEGVRHRQDTGERGNGQDRI